MFAIRNTTGALYVAKALDYEKIKKVRPPTYFPRVVRMCQIMHALIYNPTHFFAIPDTRLIKLFRVSFASNLPYQYELRLTASDNFKENYTTVLINVRDVNDNPPVFEKSSYRTQITEEDDRGLPKRVLRVSLEK